MAIEEDHILDDSKLEELYAIPKPNKDKGNESKMDEKARDNNELLVRFRTVLDKIEADWEENDAFLWEDAEFLISKYFPEIKRKNPKQYPI